MAIALIRGMAKQPSSCFFMDFSFGPRCIQVKKKYISSVFVQMLSIYVSHVTVALFFRFLPISKQVRTLDRNPLEQGEIKRTKTGMPERCYDLDGSLKSGRTLMKKFIQKTAAVSAALMVAGATNVAVAADSVLSLIHI